MSTLLKVAQMSGGTVALMSSGTYDSGTKVAASCFTHTLKKPFLDISYLRKGNRSIFRADAADQLMS